MKNNSYNFMKSVQYFLKLKNIKCICIGYKFMFGFRVQNLEYIFKLSSRLYDPDLETDNGSLLYSKKL